MSTWFKFDLILYSFLKFDNIIYYVRGGVLFDKTWILLNELNVLNETGENETVLLVRPLLKRATII